MQFRTEVNPEDHGWMLGNDKGKGMFCLLELRLFFFLVEPRIDVM